MAANYVLLERIELNASAASVVFSNIPQTGYTDLKVVVSAMNTVGLAVTTLKFNGSSSGYTYKALRGSGSAAASFDQSTWGAGAYFQTGYNINGTTPNSNEIYIPNYAGATNKSVSIDGVQEANSSTAYSFLVAGLWSNTAAITSITVAPDTDSFAANSTFSLYGLAAVGTTPAIAPKASGGNITTDGTYWIHTFLTSGTFTPAVALSCDYLVVAGGGGGGGNNTGSGGGGGGAGGFLTATGFSISAPVTVTIGAGGTGRLGNLPGTNGSNSVMSSITSTGGGGGGAELQTTGSAGGSGGGGIGGGGGGGASPSGQGNAGGGSFSGGNYGGGGGGGANAVGANGTSTVGGNGGAGLANSYSGSSVTYAGGGGGGTYNGGTAGTGGSGGGGNGSTGNAPTAGTANRGAGGGGAGSLNGNASGANGGSGIVIIRYLAA